MEYQIIHLGELLEQCGNDSDCLQVFANFSCPLDKDIEDFLKKKAINNQKRNISRTYLVYAPYQDKKHLAGYFTIAVKPLILEDTVSESIKKKITGFKSNNSNASSVFLIGQLSKNYSNGYNNIPLISGEELLYLAIKKVKEIQHMIGGRAVLVECSDKECLKIFYEKFGFIYINKDDSDGLLQYIIKISDISL